MALRSNLIIRAGFDASGMKNGIKGAQSSLRTFQSSVKRAMGAIGLAISAVAIVNFAKDCVKAATELENAMMGVQSIVEGQGRSFSEAKKFLNEYISDGLIPAAKAATAYKNLAMRGYSDEQIKTTLVALKDSAAYGRQASLTLGEAVASATEGLKNENSILVDNAGVTKNVSMMWKDYAKSIGVGVQSLTKQQKIQAEVLGIMEETRFQTGDAAKIANSYSGQVLRLGYNFNGLKVAIGNAIIPIAAAVIPSINAVIAALTRLANLVKEVVYLLFGKQVSEQKKVANTAGEAAQNTEGLADATDKAGKAAKGALAGFDELNTLTKSTAAAAGDAAGSLDTDFSYGSVTDTDMPLEDSISPKAQAIVNKLNKIIQSVKGYWDEYLAAPFKAAIDKISPQVDRLKMILFGVWTDLGDLAAPLEAWFFNDFTPMIQNAINVTGDIVYGLLDTFNMVFADIWNIIYPTFEKFITVILPIMTQVRDKCITAFGQLFDEVKRVFDTLWSEGVKPILVFIRDMWLDMIDSMAKAWDKYGDPIFEKIGVMFNKVADTLLFAWDTVIKPVWDNFMETVDWLWEKHLKPLWDNIFDFVGSVIDCGLQLINDLIIPLVNAFIEDFGPPIALVLNYIVDGFGTLIATIADIVDGIITIFKGIIKFLTGVFTGDWKKAWEGVKDVFRGIVDTFAGLIKGAVNGVIDIINAMISAVIGGLNFVIDKINSISFDMPDWMGGGHFGLSLPPIKDFKIPKLAKGGLAYSETLAIVGDNMGAASDPEVISPLSKLKDYIYSDSQLEALSYIANILEDIKAKDTDIYLDSDVIGRAAQLYSDSMRKRTGMSPVSI